ncbi:maleylpyruvate isomerase N-terminal domain-containing protein [Streptomyces sp. NPDC002536]
MSGEDDPRRSDAPPRVPGPRAAADDSAPWAGAPDAPETAAPRPALPHPVLKSLLGAWALAACSAEETTAVEGHLTDCASCADEAVRLRDAVALLHPEDSLDLDPGLRSRVLAGALGRRPARIPVPDWAAPYEAEAARLDALLHDIGEAEWRAPVRLLWFDGQETVGRDTTVAAVITHLMTVDGIVAGALGLRDPLEAVDRDACVSLRSPTARTEAYWAADGAGRAPAAVHAAWRDQGRSLIRKASFDAGRVAGLAVEYGPFALPLRDSFLDRAFECWVHAGDIAEAVAYPYTAPSSTHLHRMIDLAARLLPTVIAGRRRAGLAAPARELVPAGTVGRSLHLEIEGSGGGHWYIPLDSPGAVGGAEGEVAHVAVEGVEFCRLASGRVSPTDAAAGGLGDREAIRDVLYAAASLSRL